MKYESAYAHDLRRWQDEHEQELSDSRYSAYREELDDEAYAELRMRRKPASAVTRKHATEDAA